jgi:hypothetical protein
MLYEQNKTQKIDKTVPSKNQRLNHEHDKLNQELIRQALRGERFNLTTETYND